MKILISVALLIGLTAGHAYADEETLKKVRELYAAAAYEEVLAVLKALPEETAAPEINEYRVFCLLALGQHEQAQTPVERLLMADPSYRPDTSDTSPRMIQDFTEVRNRVLPTVVKRLYRDAKAALDNKNRQRALEGFEKLLLAIDAAPTDASLEDMKVLAAGFRDLSKALPEPAPLPPATEGVSNESVAGARANAPRGRVTPPVAIKQEFPAWNFPDAVSRRLEFSGLLRVQVGPDGRVTSAELMKRLHPGYDQVLLRATQKWLYEPATQDGVPVPGEVHVQVRLRPQE